MQNLLNVYCNRQIATVYCLKVGSSSAEGKTLVGTLLGGAAMGSGHKSVLHPALQPSLGTSFQGAGPPVKSPIFKVDQ